MANIIVQVNGEDAGNFTAIVRPLTVAQFQLERGTYGTICDSIINGEIDTAEGN